MANKIVLGYDGEETHSAWDCFEMECGFSAPLPVRVATSGRRKKMKNLGLLCLGLGLGKMGLGFSGLGSGSIGPGLGSVSKSSALVLGSDSRSNVISSRIPVSSKVVNEQIQPEASSTVSSSSTVFDEQSLRPEVTGSLSTMFGSSTVSSMSSVCTDESWVSDFSDYVDPGLGSIFVSSHVGAADDESGPSLVVPTTLEPVLSTRLVSEPTMTMVPGSTMPVGSPCLPAYTQLGFGLAKSQIWLLEWIKDRLKINEEVKDEDHLAFLKVMGEDFQWINLITHE
jgi:hypothetical protein